MKDQKNFDLIVVGGGAAGFFGAIQVAEHNPSLRILILEKSNKLLSKVRISGGGRCNVTHHCFEPTPLSKHYPRGQKELKTLFRQYQAKDVVDWFEKHDVKLKVEPDGRMFPTTNRSETIINCFIQETRRHNIEIQTGVEVIKVERGGKEFTVYSEDHNKYQAKKILIAIGGHPKKEFYKWVAALGHTIHDPIPSLFTFNDSNIHFKDLMGVSVPNASVMIEGTKYKQQGPVLITHWGLSGPAVIKLSAWAATYLFSKNYIFTALVNWLGETGEEELRQKLEAYGKQHPRQKVMANVLFELPQRLWLRLCELAQLDGQKVWSEISKKQLNKLIENLIRCRFDIKGKTTFKEEFVTCGGVKLEEIELQTMESKKVSGLYFAGEVLDIDGETGGFNFQSAWTTAYVAASAISKVC